MRRLISGCFCGGIFGLLGGLALAASPAGAGNTARNAWPAETLTGTIMMVVPNLDLVVVQGPDKVPFDMRVNHSTSIRSGDKTLTLPDLGADTNRSVSVTFVPTGSGDVARAIRIMG